MAHVRTALYLDFDNVFSGLYKLDPEVAVQFASDPGAWLSRLSTAPRTDAPRRWLVLRCYLNPAGWVPNPDPTGEQPRLFFSKFRPSFVRAGFDVIDCPRYSGMKNAADIRIVVDALDALSADTRYDEFVIASGDSDMTPLLQRLRRSDRRTMIVSPADAAEALTAIADQALDSQHLLALVQGESVDFDDDTETEVHTELDQRVADIDGAADHAEAYEIFRSTVTREYDQASEPLNMASLAHRLHAQVGRSVAESNWFGSGSFARAVASLKLPNLRTSQHLMWDGSRHSVSEEAVAAPQRIALPEAVERLVDQLGVPRLPQPWWPAIYHALADYAQSHRFNLTQCTSWSRDQLRDQGLPISRGAVGFVVRGASYGGCPLHRQPAPAAAEIGAAFAGNVLSRAEHAEIILSDDEVATVRTWLGALPAEETAEGQAGQPSEVVSSAMPGGRDGTARA
ncbi:NYN domain-containing protein [Micromonospora viridifaciens]|uniref:NYN domain-containing protein n=1 Tax=Micromonospora viridifaciens TaxID=1881 RepID=A0A1C4Z698_MICVI|nr:NYN domain-containing protein [Micromonospora viridifaciens]SCF28443.1 NYN domain-containing protein [Micromonospora viridifaciens]